MVYSRKSKSRSQSLVNLKDDPPLSLPVLQAPDLSSVYNFFADDKYPQSTVTSQFLTTQFLSSTPRFNYPMQQSPLFPALYGRPFVPNFAFNMYYNR